MYNNVVRPCLAAVLVGNLNICDGFDARFVFEAQTRRDSEKAQLELDERKEDLKLQKEREQLHKR